MSIMKNFNSESVSKYTDILNNNGVLKRSENCFYNNNPKYRKKGINYSYNNYEIMELSKSINDVSYFGDKIIGIDFYKYQLELLNHISLHEHSLINTARQMGISLILAVYSIYESCLKGKSVVIISPKSDSAKNFFDKIIDIYENLPFYVKPGVSYLKRNTIMFDNNGRVKVINRIDSYIYGRNDDLYIMDDFAFMNTKDVNDIKSIIFPTVFARRNSKLIISSTPSERKSIFNKLVYDSKREIGDPEKNTFSHIALPYWKHPERDIKWRENIINTLGSYDIFVYEYDCKLKI